MKRTLPLLLVLVLAACASKAPEGVKMTNDEISSCKAQGCTVWTDVELQMLAQEAFKEGFLAGRASAKKQNDSL